MSFGAPLIVDYTDRLSFNNMITNSVNLAMDQKNPSLFTSNTDSVLEQVYQYLNSVPSTSVNTGNVSFVGQNSITSLLPHQNIHYGIGMGQHGTIIPSQFTENTRYESGTSGVQKIPVQQHQCINSPIIDGINPMRTTHEQYNNSRENNTSPSGCPVYKIGKNNNIYAPPLADEQQHGDRYIGGVPIKVNKSSSSVEKIEDSKDIKDTVIAALMQEIQKTREQLIKCKQIPSSSVDQYNKIKKEQTINKNKCVIG
jgi:hypothetical protein